MYEITDKTKEVKPIIRGSLKPFLRKIKTKTSGHNFKAMETERKIIAQQFFSLLKEAIERITSAHASKSKFPRAIANRKGNAVNAIEMSKIPVLLKKFKLPIRTPAQKKTIIMKTTKRLRSLKAFNKRIPNGG